MSDALNLAHNLIGCQGELIRTGYFVQDAKLSRVIGLLWLWVDDYQRSNHVAFDPEMFFQLNQNNRCYFSLHAPSRRTPWFHLMSIFLERESMTTYGYRFSKDKV
jgi:hypothetical protein